MHVRQEMLHCTFRPVVKDECSERVLVAIQILKWDLNLVWERHFVIASDSISTNIEARGASGRGTHEAV